MSAQVESSRESPAGDPSRSVRLVCTAADESRTDPLTWAQQHMLRLIESLGPRTESLNIRFAVRLRPGLSEADALRGVQDLMATCDALRSTYLPPPEGPAQRVARTVELVVPVFDVDVDEAADAAAGVTDWLASAPFDISGEWPIRVALVGTGGHARYLIVVMSHLAVDDAGAYLVKHRLQPVLARQLARVRTSATLVRPLDEAMWERSPAGERHGRRAVRQHEATFRVMPQTMLPRAAVDPAELELPRYRYLQFDSPALAMAVPALVARHKTSAAAVLYAGVCSVVGFRYRLDRAYLQLTVGNRVARNETSVGMYTEDVPVCVDLTDAGMADLISRSGTAVLQGARFGHYPPDDVARRRHAVEIERGVALDLTWWLNYRRAHSGAVSGDERLDAAVLRDAADRTRWRWIDGVDNSTSSCFVFADDSGTSLRLTVLLDSALLPPDEVVTWLRSVEQVLCATVTHDVGVADVAERTGLAAVSRDDSWHLVDHNWVHLPTVADLVRRTARVSRVDVYVVPGPDGERLCACLDGTSSDVDLLRLHADVLEALPAMRTAIAPHSYVVCAGSPDRDELDAWRRLPVLTAGSGRPAM